MSTAFYTITAYKFLCRQAWMAKRQTDRDKEKERGSMTDMSRVIFLSCLTQNCVRVKTATLSVNMLIETMLL